MKTRNLFLSLFAFAALCACNKEADPVGPEVLQNDAYVAINICTSNDSFTKAPTDGGNVEGTTTENEVKEAYFLFYKDGTFSQAASFSIGDMTSSTGNVEAISQAVVVLSGQTIVPNQVLVLLNASDNLKTAVKGVELTKVQAIFDDYSSTDNGFLMSNSVYYSDGVVCTAAIAASNIKNSEDEAKTAGVNIYVERVLSKVSVDQGDTFSDKMDEDQVVTVDGTDVTLTHEICGYYVTPQINKSYLLKNIQGINDDTKYWNDWNDPTNYRSYWANTPSSDIEYTYYSFNDISSEDPYVAYLQENTSKTENPKLIVVAQLQKDGAAYTVYKYMDKFYTEAGYKALAVERLNNAGATYNGAAFTAENLKVVPTGDQDPETDKKEYYVGLALADDGATVTGEPTTILNGMGDAQCWNNGMCYFYTDIEHVGTYDEEQLSGLVRNHQYNVIVNSIKGWGTPIYSADYDIIPEKRVDDEFSYVAATVNILSWKVITQNVELE